MQRSWAIDLLKILAAQVIVLHHLSTYGALPELVRQQFPHLVDFLFMYGRMAVQIFLVTAGFLAAQSYASKRTIDLSTQLIQRYLRLVPVYLLALVWVVFTVEIARPSLLGSDLLTEVPTFAQVLSHVVLLHGVLNYPSLSTGVWYVAIDFQLYAMLTVILVSCRRKGKTTVHIPKAAVWCVLVLGLAALLVLSHHDALDNWGLYFFGSYGLGVLAAWGKHSRQYAMLFGLALSAALLNWWIEPRERVAISACTALIVFLHTPAQPWGDNFWHRLITRLADSSYSLFLIHFGVIVLANLAWQKLSLDGPMAALLCAAMAWIASILLGIVFHARVETPVQKWLSVRFRKI